MICWNIFAVLGVHRFLSEYNVYFIEIIILMQMSNKLLISRIIVEPVNICDMIKGNESDVADIVFEI